MILICVSKNKILANVGIRILCLSSRDLYPMLLVANKVDLVHLRKVSEESGRELAQRLAIPYIETSAKDPPLNVDAAFHEVVRIIRHQPPAELEKNRRSKRRPSKCVVL